MPSEILIVPSASTITWTSSTENINVLSQDAGGFIVVQNNFKVNTNVPIYGYFPVVVYTGTPSYFLEITDSLKYIRTTGATNYTFSVRNQSTVSWPSYTEILFEQAGAGQITIAGSSGVIVNYASSTISKTQYSVIGLKRLSTDTWIVFGDTE